MNIAEHVGNKPAGGCECRISTVGAGKLGMYFPKDVLRVMEIIKKVRAIVTPLTKEDDCGVVPGVNRIVRSFSHRVDTIFTTSRSSSSLPIRIFRLASTACRKPSPMSVCT